MDCAGMVEAEEQFRRVRRYTALPPFVIAIKRRLHLTRP
jgi:hypothetical protein